MRMARRYDKKTVVILIFYGKRGKFPSFVSSSSFHSTTRDKKSEKNVIFTGGSSPSVRPSQKPWRSSRSSQPILALLRTGTIFAARCRTVTRYMRDRIRCGGSVSETVMKEGTAECRA